MLPKGAAVSDDPPDRPGDTAARLRAKKSPNAFRTISEVADELHIPQHVLRFWETKFPQVRPLKRGGGRRYYRPDDIILLRRIADLLYTQGYTIKGVQRLLREGGGQLSEDIPPPTADERAAADANQAAADSSNTGRISAENRGAFPGFDLVPPSLMHIGRSPADPRRDGARDDGEVIKLRRLLQEALKELEALRSLLP